jgi:hypothetical protein
VSPFRAGAAQLALVLSGIDDHARVSCLDRLEKIGMTADQRKQTVFGVNVFCVGNFDRGRSSRNEMEIPDR